jgi:hypothetical protein
MNGYHEFHYLAFNSDSPNVDREPQAKDLPKRSPVPLTTVNNTIEDVDNQAGVIAYNKSSPTHLSYRPSEPFMATAALITPLPSPSNANRRRIDHFLEESSGMMCSISSEQPTDNIEDFAHRHGDSNSSSQVMTPFTFDFEREGTPTDRRRRQNRVACVCEQAISYSD